MTQSMQEWRREASRGRIIEAATALFAERGVEATSMSDIAAAAGLRAPSLYHYFEDRRELLIAAVRSAGELAVAHARTATADGATSAERIVSFLGSQAEFLDEYGQGMIRLLYGTIFQLADDPEVMAVKETMLSGLRDVFRDVVDDGQRTGDLTTAADARTAVRMLMSCLTGIELAYALDPEGRTAVEMFDGVAELVTRYLAVDPALPPEGARG